MQPFYIDEVLQVFKSDSNFQIVLGACSGTVDQKGAEVKEAIAKLIIPSSQMEKIIESLKEACQVLGLDSSNITITKPESVFSEPEIREGAPIVFRTS